MISHCILFFCCTGASPDTEIHTGNKYSKGIEVCIKDFEIRVGNNPSNLVNLSQDARAGVNVENCMF